MLQLAILVKSKKFFFSQSEKALQIARTAFLSNLIEIYGQQLTKNSILLNGNLITNGTVLPIFQTLFCLLSDALFEFMRGVH